MLKLREILGTIQNNGAREKGVEMLRVCFQQSVTVVQNGFPLASGKAGAKAFAPFEGRHSDQR
jgi:hypothetical protein